MRNRRSLLMAGVFLLTATGCASAGGAAGGEGRGNTITAEDLADVGNVTLFVAIQRLRPRWLRSRGGSPLPVVFIDGIRRGGPSELRNMPANSVTQVRFIDGRAATTRYGIGFGGGAIEVTTR
ncbi:MAG: hypothetical protein BMS9Abin29_0874 [Gemmatimonadota bacterium]|nr:MAG: hypothetical protein BMS9Abin29_0874 [Gemmatimonadota bacterium]